MVLFYNYKITLNLEVLTMNDSLSHSRRTTSAFSLAEMLIVIAVIGIIAAVAIPSISRINQSATAAATAANYSNFSKAFIAYEKLEGDWPPDNIVGIMPPGVDMEHYITESMFESPTPVGGHFNWEGPENHAYAGVSIQGSSAPSEIFERIDAILDDGNLSTGYFRRTPNGRYTYIIEWNNP